MTFTSGSSLDWWQALRWELTPHSRLPRHLLSLLPHEHTLKLHDSLLHLLQWTFWFFSPIFSVQYFKNYPQLNSPTPTSLILLLLPPERWFNLIWGRDTEKLQEFSLDRTSSSIMKGTVLLLNDLSSNHVFALYFSQENNFRKVS